MGYMRHHTIVVTGHELETVHSACVEIAKKHNPIGCDGSIFTVSPLSEKAMNGYVSFAVFPDGSKEWWEHSDCGDRARDEIVELLKQHNRCAWVEVQFGDDEGDTKIICDSSHPEGL